MRGEAFIKAEHNRTLQKILTTRTRGSIEKKHQNISAVLLEHALRPHLRRPGGRIVAISSAAAYGVGGEVAYASCKAAMNRWVLTLASEVGADGIITTVAGTGQKGFGGDGGGLGRSAINCLEPGLCPRRHGQHRPVRLGRSMGGTRQQCQDIAAGLR